MSSLVAGSAARGLASTDTAATALAATAHVATPLQGLVEAVPLDPTLAHVALIVLPIVASALALAAGLVRPRTGWPVALVALVAEAGVAAWLALAVAGSEGARLVHELGGYGRPETFAIGIELVADPLSALLVVVIAGVALGVLAIGRLAGPRGNAFYSAYLLLVGGLMGVALTGDLFNLFVFLEITGLATYTLVASNDGADSAVAALKYLIVGTTGASFYLVGVGYLFLATGTLNMQDLSSTLAGQTPLEGVSGAMYADPLVVVGFAFVAVGLFVKAAIFPLHTWQPDAYAAAPDAVTTLISALVSTMGAYAFARVALTVFTPEFFDAVPIAATAVVALGSLSVVAGTALAVVQSDVKRTFAYSSVSQFGLIAAAVGVAVHPVVGSAPDAARAALVGAVIHLVGHAVVKGGVFAALAGLSLETGARRVRDYAELGRTSPLLAGCLAVLGLTLVGVPPTVGFLGKWYIAWGAIGKELWPVAAVVLVSTLLTLAYVGRLLEQLYFTPGDVVHDGAEVGGHDRTSGGHAVAADGGEGPTSGDGGGTPSADGGRRHAHRTGRAPIGVVAFVVVATLLAVVLGFAGAELAGTLDPFVTEVLEG